METASELFRVAQSGPIAIIINPNDNIPLALILLSGASETIYVPIPDFGISDVHRLSASLASAMSQDLLFRSTNVPRAALLASFEEIFESILGELRYQVVRPIFDILAMALPPDDVQDRLVWCPTDPLAFFPLHAAGDYTKAERGFKVYDFVVSSYIPTLSSLFDSANASNEHHPFHLTAVAVSSPQGEAAIPATHEEVAAIRSLFKDNEKSYSELMEQSASPSSVLDRMHHASSLATVPKTSAPPTHSALLLTGTSRLTLSDIIQESLPSAEFAFLSACQTAPGHATLPEEFAHLAAGLLLAGYKGVVATMWIIMDRDAPAVTRDVYGYLLRDRGDGGQPDYTEAAYALHRAVGKLRQRVGTKAYLSWVPFIHIGR